MPHRSRDAGHEARVAAGEPRVRAVGDGAVPKDDESRAEGIGDENPAEVGDGRHRLARVGVGGHGPVEHRHFPFVANAWQRAGEDGQPKHDARDEHVDQQFRVAPDDAEAELADGPTAGDGVEEGHASACHILFIKLAARRQP